MVGKLTLPVFLRARKSCVFRCEGGGSDGGYSCRFTVLQKVSSVQCGKKIDARDYSFFITRDSVFFDGVSGLFSQRFLVWFVGWLVNSVPC